MLWLLAIIAGGVVLAVGAGQLGLFNGTPPGDLGVHAGRLKAPAVTPNNVSSQADLWPGAGAERARIAPLALQGDGPATIARLKTLMDTRRGARVVEARPDYLYVQFTTRLMKFTDDTEFWFDPGAQVVHVRSASRLGESDLGVNRERIESIRQALAAR